MQKLCAPPGHALQGHVGKEDIEDLNGKVVPKVARLTVGSRRLVAESLPSHHEKEKHGAGNDDQDNDDNAQYLKGGVVQETENGVAKIFRAGEGRVRKVVVKYRPFFRNSGGKIEK